MPETPDLDLNDASLVKQAKSGDTQAFGLLYQRYAENILRFFFAQLPDMLDAEDLTSEVFLRAWGALPRYRERGYPFSAFLFRIARNALIDHQRKKTKEVNKSQKLIESLASDNMKISDRIFEKQTHQYLWRYLNEIRDNYRSVLVLRFINDLSTREVAKILKCSEGSVRVMQHRGLKALREKIGRNSGVTWASKRNS
jgi:RNA polymerase sigma-70 factor (ECF subfamily)